MRRACRRKQNDFAKNDGQKSKRESKAILTRRGWADETREPRREQLRRHFVDDCTQFKVVKFVKKRAIRRPRFYLWL